jgi:hypothetical protein
MAKREADEQLTQDNQNDEGDDEVEVGAKPFLDYSHPASGARPLSLAC